MKKPYIKKYTEISKFKIWIVDGKYVRDHMNIEFTNCAHHLNFKFIPENEFWIDKENVHGEIRYYIDYMLAEHRSLEQGISLKEAIKIADKIEQRERSKSKLIIKKAKEKATTEKLLKKIHKKLLKKYSGKIKVWTVNGELVRDCLFIDFTEGGHDKVYPFIPKNEIWIDDDLNENEIKFVFLHELHERNLMMQEWAYAFDDDRPLISFINKKAKIKKSAHYSASHIEYYCRHHPKLTQKYIKKEIAISEKL